MSDQYRAVFRELSQPMEPIPTGEQPVLRPLPGIRAVLFDIYGTLVISGSGDVGTTAEQLQSQAFVAALGACGIPFSGSGDTGVRHLLAAVHGSHERSRQRGVEHPEVEITDVWRQTLRALADEGRVPRAAAQTDPALLAVHYETRVNPAWGMPSARECLAELRRRGLLLGIVSNAQFFTLELLPALFGQSIPSLGFDEELQYYSFQFGEAKPSARMYVGARQTLGERGIRPAQTLYIGNDMLNDIWPASGQGFCSALFAGDARSLRLRRGDARTAALIPDLILSDLSQLVSCLPQG